MLIKRFFLSTIAGALALAGCSASQSTADHAKSVAAQPLTVIQGTDEAFTSEAIYFVVTDRFVDGDPSNNHEDQGGDNPTWELRMDGPGW